MDLVGRVPAWAWGMMAVAAMVTAADQVSKALAAHYLIVGYHCLEREFALCRAQNFSPAFAVGATPASRNVRVMTEFSGLLLAAGFASSRRVRPLTLGLLAGGAISNVANWLVTGYVTDFITIRNWGIVDLADLAIFSGTALVVGELLWRTGSRLVRRPGGPPARPL
jgi:lipoprotein signal peptidase